MRKRIRQQLRMTWLMLVNLVRLRQLKVLEFHTERRFVNNATRTDIFWDVQGCHKIKVEGFGTYAGNINGVSMLEKQEAEHIAVTFIGWANSYTHVFHISASLEKTLHAFRDETEKRLDKQNIVVSDAFTVFVNLHLSSQIEPHLIEPINLVPNQAISNLSVSFTSPKIHVS